MYDLSYVYAYIFCGYDGERSYHVAQRTDFRCPLLFLTSEPLRADTPGTRAMMIGTLLGLRIMSSRRHSHLAASTMSPLLRSRARQPSTNIHASRNSPSAWLLRCLGGTGGARSFDCDSPWEEAYIDVAAVAVSVVPSQSESEAESIVTSDTTECKLSRAGISADGVP
jgi:hypothetical protein